MKTNNLNKLLSLNLRKIAKPAALCICIMFILSSLSVLSFATVKATASPTYLTNNAVFIQDDPLESNQPLAATNLDSTVATLQANNIKYVFECIGKYGFDDTDTGWTENNATYETFIADCHAVGIKVLAWMENENPINLLPSNYASMVAVYNSVLSIGFDGINSDIEMWGSTTGIAPGSYQDFINYNNYMATTLNAEGKLWMPDVPGNVNNDVYHVDAIVSMFYSDESYFEPAAANNQVVAYWENEFSPTPASPVI